MGKNIKKFLTKHIDNTAFIFYNIIKNNLINVYYFIQILPTYVNYSIIILYGFDFVPLPSVPTLISGFR